MSGVVPPLKYIRSYKQQTAQQHGAADLSAGAARHGESEAQNGLTRRVGDRCGGDAAFRQNSLSTCFKSC